MSTLSYKTVSANENTVNKEWLVVDAEGQRLGRLASEVAAILRGKHKTDFTPHVDCGDNVVIINADKVVLTGNKWEDKQYVRFSGYPGGQRFRSANEMMNRKPTAMVELAVKGMLPKTKLGRAIGKNLYVYAGSEHKHEAQQPKAYELKG